MTPAPRVTLPAPLANDCVAFGHALVANWKRLGFTTYRGAELNPERQAAARMAESAVCLWAGLDPRHALDWGLHDYGDAGFDVDAFGRRIEVKSTAMHGRYLVWPRCANHAFDGLAFDVLALVKCRPPIAELTGWIPKDRFRVFRHTAPAGHRLDAGTWFVDQTVLLPFPVLQWWGCMPWR